MDGDPAFYSALDNGELRPVTLEGGRSAIDLGLVEA